MSNNSNESIGSRIRDIRLSLGLSMTEFAERVDPNGKAKSGTVSNWEHGKNAPNNLRLKRIAELGGVSVNYLRTGVAVADIERWDNELNAASKEEVSSILATLTPEYLSKLDLFQRGLYGQVIQILASQKVDAEELYILLARLNNVDEAFSAALSANFKKQVHDALK